MQSHLAISVIVIRKSNNHIDRPITHMNLTSTIKALNVGNDMYYFLFLTYSIASPAAAPSIKPPTAKPPILLILFDSN